VLDARRCISYLTIEHRGFIPRDLRPQMGRWVYGCDVCQQVCPWQRFAPPAALAEFAAPDIDRAAPLLTSLLMLDEAMFARRFCGTAIFRIGRDRLVRNACVAAGNSGLPELSAHLQPLLTDTSPLVRGHAAWALGMLGTGHDTLRTALSRETEQAVCDEIKAALG
jgi:epoxyqueuosine reductase